MRSCISIYATCLLYALSLVAQEDFSETLALDLPELEAAVGEPKDPLSEDALNQFINLEEIPSGIVSNINVITGHYCQFEQDLVIPSSQPIRIERMYTPAPGGRIHFSGPLFNHWRTNCEGTLLHLIKKGKRLGSSYVEMRDGVLVMNGPLAERGRYKWHGSDKCYSFDNKL
jgi:hypothetical protein